ncbi:hypothetical protein LUZ63_003843 [Rhynchospora breviuscula]|uniref:Uncharacterized protein n=1 Tax=Rhynchospora breviuscula TaxID=2022672 RepID=A0A9Q0D1F6_9POAL|nr:hypothetical protein LUZ63_003843 [Rhynchospora breviuscula]
MASTPSSPKHSQSSSSSSPEFEFWGVVGTNNPSTIPPIDLPSADELFSDGILLPLQNLNISTSDNKPTSDASNSFIDPSSFPSSSPSPGPASKRWKDIFIKAGERERRKEKTRLSVGNNAELNINLWPFSRSRSAGNASSIGSWGRNKLPVKLAAGRTVSSAPCSRSNSRNEESSGADGSQINSSTASSIIKRWAQTGKLTPNGGIRVGRPGPVWQLRRKKQQLQQQEAGDTKETAGADKKDAHCANAGVKMLNLNVNTCIGYRNQVSCSDGAGGGGNAGMFSFKAIFSKKVY